MSKITLDILLERKIKQEQDKMKIIPFNSEILGGTIEIVKGKLRDIVKMMDNTDKDNVEEGLKSNLKLIYKHCPIFKNKELQESYEVAEPYEVILEVFDQNLGEVNKLSNAILNLYGIGEKESNKGKNIVEKEIEGEIEDLKN